VQPEKKDFQVVLIWETAWNPDDARGEVKAPAGRTYKVSYRFVDRDRESRKLAEWFGKDNVGRYKNPDELKNFVEGFLP